MKKINLLLVSLLVVFIGVFTSCEEDAAESTLDFFGGDYIDGNATVTAGATLNFKITATSTKDMEYIEVENEGYGVIWDALIDNAEKSNYTKVISFPAPAGAGTYTYSFVIYGEDDMEIVSKSVVITVTAASNITEYTGKLLFVPDAAKTANVYFASSTGTAYSYNGVGSNSGLVDWGYYYGTSAHHTFFALTQQPTLGYDIASWTKNATKMKKLTGVDFTAVTTGTAIESAIGTIGTVEKVEGLAVNDVIGFKTAANKYGLIKITAKSADSNAEGTNITFSVKVQQ